MSFENAMSWEARANQAIAHGALTNSKRPECFVKGVYPTHLAKGKGCYVYDEKGRRWIDFICALGTNLLGYAHRDINDRVKTQLDSGALFSLSSTLEVEFAEKVKETFSYVDRVRVLKTGTEGCLAAIRIARAATGREIILIDGYHGWGDDTVSLTPPANGVPLPRPWVMPLSSKGIPGILDKTAAIIIEPVITDFSLGRVQELQELRTLCDKHKVALIYDETITAMRFPSLSVASHTGIYPDISVFGKALANGLPISVVAGRAKLMDADYFVSSSFAGDCLAMRAAIETLKLAKAAVNGMWDYGERFQADFNLIMPGFIRIEGYPTRGIFRAKDDLTKALFFQEACKAGVLFGSTFFWCEPHAEESNFVLSLCRTILKRIANGEVKLEGELPVTPFAQKQREKT